MNYGMRGEGWGKRNKKNKAHGFRCFPHPTLLIPHPKRGFTLIETLLAVTLFAIVMSSSYGIFSMGIQIWRRTQGADVYERQAITTLERMGRDFRMMLKTTDELNAGEGTAQKVIFPFMVTDYDRDGTPFFQNGKIGYEFDKNKKTLCMRKYTATDLYKEREPECRVLVEEVQKLKFKYWLYEGIGESFSWYERWDGEESIPQAIEVTLELNSQLKGESSAKKREYIRKFLVPVGGKEEELETEEV